MITARKVFKADSYYIEYRGLHADPKPVNAKEGDVFKELDTDSVYKFEGGKWTFSPGGAGGEGLSDGIDIIGTDKELKDLSGIAVGFDLPDIPGTEDVTATSSIDLDPETAPETGFYDGVRLLFEPPLPFDFGMDFDDLSKYSYDDQTVIFPKPIIAEIHVGDAAVTVTYPFAVYAKYEVDGETNYNVEFFSPDEAADYVECGYEVEEHAVWLDVFDVPSDVTNVTATLTQKGTPAVTGRASEIAAKYLESPEVEEGLKFNALKEVGVGYVKEGDSVTVVNDGTGDTADIDGLSYRKVSDVFPFDISGETEESQGGALITLDMPITMEFSNPAMALEVGNSIPYIASYPASMTGGVTVHVGAVSIEDPLPLFFYAEDDVELPGGTLLKGLWVLDTAAPVNAAITSLTQGEPGVLHKIDAKYLDIPPVIDGEGTTGLEHFSKIAVGGLKGLNFTYVEDDPYEVIESPYAKLIKIAEFGEINLESVDGALTNPILYRYYVNLNGTEQEVSGEFDTVSFTNGAYHIYDNGEESDISLTANQREISEMGITIPSGVWSMFALEEEGQLVPLKISQTEVVKISAEYLERTAPDAEVWFSMSSGSTQVLSTYTGSFEALADKLYAGKSIDIKAYTHSAPYGYMVNTVSYVSVNMADNEIIAINFGISNGSIAGTLTYTSDTVTWSQSGGK